MLLRKDGEETELCGGEPADQQSHGVAHAVIEALQWFTQPVKARVYTDSQYVQRASANGFTAGNAGDGKQPVRSR